MLGQTASQWLGQTAYQWLGQTTSQWLDVSVARADGISAGFALPPKSCMMSLHTVVCVHTTALRASISSLICSMHESSTHTSMLSNVTGGRLDRLCATNVNGNPLFRLYARAMMSLIVPTFLCSHWCWSSRHPDPHSSKKLASSMTWSSYRTLRITESHYPVASTATCG